MPAKNPRLQVALSEELLARYKAVGEAFSQPASKVAADILSECIVSLEAAAEFLRAAKADQRNASQIVAHGLTKLVTDVRQGVADVQLDLEDAIAESKKKKKSK